MSSSLLSTAKAQVQVFMIADGYLLTAAHNLTNEQTGLLNWIFNGARKKISYFASTPANNNSDWMLVKLKGTLGSKMLMNCAR